MKCGGKSCARFCVVLVHISARWCPPFVSGRGELRANSDFESRQTGFLRRAGGNRRWPEQSVVCCARLSEELAGGPRRLLGQAEGNGATASAGALQRHRRDAPGAARYLLPLSPGWVQLQPRSHAASGKGAETLPLPWRRGLSPGWHVALCWVNPQIGFHPCPKLC